MHGSATPYSDPDSRPFSAVDDPLGARIAALSREFLDADAPRRVAIGAEIRALIDGSLVPLAPGRRAGEISRAW